MSTRGISWTWRSNSERRGSVRSRVALLVGQAYAPRELVESRRARRGAPLCRSGDRRSRPFALCGGWWGFAVGGAERRCAGLETGVPGRLRCGGWWGFAVGGAERRCAGLETGVPGRLRCGGWWGFAVGGAERRCAGLETGVPGRLRCGGWWGFAVGGAERRCAGLETGVPGRLRCVGGGGVLPWAARSAAVPVWRPALQAVRVVGGWWGFAVGGAERRCAGLETGVPGRRCYREWMSRSSVWKGMSSSSPSLPTTAISS